MLRSCIHPSPCSASATTHKRRPHATPRAIARRQPNLPRSARAPAPLTPEPSGGVQHRARPHARTDPTTSWGQRGARPGCSEGTGRYPLRRKQRPALHRELQTCSVITPVALSVWSRAGTRRRSSSRAHAAATSWKDRSTQRDAVGLRCRGRIIARSPQTLTGRVSAAPAGSAISGYPRTDAGKHRVRRSPQPSGSISGWPPNRDFICRRRSGPPPTVHGHGHGRRAGRVGSTTLGSAGTSGGRLPQSMLGALENHAEACSRPRVRLSGHRRDDRQRPE